MDFLIFQNASEHPENYDYRESQNLRRAILRAGHHAECAGVGYPPVDFDKSDVIIFLEQYDFNSYPQNYIQNTNTHKIFWSIDGHCNTENHVEWARRCRFDTVYSSCVNNIGLFRGYTGNSYWLPNACPTDLINAAPRALRPVSVGYCGTPGNQARRDALNTLINTVELHPDIWVLGDKMAATLAGYKISWNMNVSHDINYRTFESMAAGAMLITNETPGLNILFKDGEDCIYYNNIDECIEMVWYYLSHENERLKIAESGHKLVTENHSYDARVAEIINNLK